ncbi:MAG: DUF58 domain-containing protein [Wenzhouxiangellaceae bacterium]
MWSPSFWSTPAFAEGLTSALGRRFERWLKPWLSRRGPLHPPLTLGYRQIFILPTAFGWQLGALLTAMLLGSLNFNTSLGLLTTFVVAGSGLAAMHLNHRNLLGLRVLAVELPSVFAGQPLRIGVTMEAADLRRHYGIRLTTPESATAIEQVEPGKEAYATLELPPLPRGRHAIGRIAVRTRWPLGWFESWSWFWPQGTLLVWPAPAATAPPLPRHGHRNPDRDPGDENDEFHGLRDWREGDPVHRIAWKASQRHDQLLTRQFSRPQRQRLEFSLDRTPGRDLEERLSVLCRWVLEADHRQFDYALDLGRVRIETGQGPSHRVRCLNALAEV